MKKKLVIVLMIVIIFFIIYPLIEINIDKRIIKFSYNDDISMYEDMLCYDESYIYNEDRDISIYDVDFKKLVFFYVIVLEYKEGNVCDTEYVLEEEYINNFIENAIIGYNDNNIDIAKLISGKKAIVGNKKYLGNDYLNSISYILDGKEEIMYVFYLDDLLVIQVGLSDEGPKYIAYK